MRDCLGLCLVKSKVSFPFRSSDLLPACDGERPTLAFLQDVMNILLQYVVKSFDRSTKVIDFHYPNELLQEYNWELADQPQNLEEILTHCQTTLKYAIKTGIVQPAIIKLFFVLQFSFFSIKSFLFLLDRVIFKTAKLHSFKNNHYND